MTTPAAVRRVRRVDPFLLICAAAGLLCAALLAAIAVAVTHVGTDWPDSALVATDGQPHEVPVATSRTAMLWTINGGDHHCTVADASDVILPLEPTSGSYRRNDMAWDWVGIATVTPTSPTVTVTCDGVPDGTVALETKPRGPAFLAGVSRWFAIPALLAVLGLILGVAGLVTGVRSGGIGRR